MCYFGKQALTVEANHFSIASFYQCVILFMMTILQESTNKAPQTHKPQKYHIFTHYINAFLIGFLLLHACNKTF